MPKIESISIQGFRSFGPNPTDATFDAPLAVFWGANSQGKTSLSEALEFLFTGDIARRALLTSSVDEFENALRNAHIQDDTDVFVEAAIVGTDGKRHTLRRTLDDDFTKKKPCTSTLYLDGNVVDSSATSNIGISLSEPPLAAPILMQHTLGYLFSAGPKQRASYFKTLLEVTDLDEIRDALRSVVATVPLPSTEVRDKVAACQADLPAVSETLAPLSSPTITVPDIENAITIATSELLVAAGAKPEESFGPKIDQLEALANEKQEDAFPLEAFERPVQTADWTDESAASWADIDAYKSRLGDVDRETQRLSAFFEQVLKLPSVREATEDIDCPVCESPSALTQSRVQAIRDLVKDTSDFRAAEAKAKTAISALSSSASNLETAARTACPNFIAWGRQKRNSKGYKSNAIAPLLDEELRPLVPVWFRSAVNLMRHRRSVRQLAAAALDALKEFQTDATRLEDDASLRQAFEPLLAAHAQLETAIEEYGQAMKPLADPLRSAVVTKSDTTGWDGLVELGRSAPMLEQEQTQSRSHAQLKAEFEQACKEVEAAKEAVLEEKFDALATDVRAWWNLLRPDEATFFSDLGLRKKAQRTIDFQAGLATSTEQKNPKLRNAVAVFSQSQMHCLGLATFLARTCTGGGFIVLDDPIVSIDDDYSAHFINGVLSRLLELDVQVILLTYNQRTWTTIQSGYDGGRCQAFELNLDEPANGTTILPASDGMGSLLASCKPFTKGALLQTRKDGTSRIRDAAERLCKEILVKKRRAQGDKIAMVSDYTGKDGQLGALITKLTPYLDADEPGKLKQVAQYTNPGNHDDDVASSGALTVSLGNLVALKKKYLG